MRDNGPITDTEVPVPDGALLVSQTDPKGRITFANDTFVAISGFTREELVGSPHNIVRHPHMPKEAFGDLWTTIKAGRPWEALVKNRTKQGNFYWVRANVTPVVENGELQGFISIRTRPERAAVEEAEAAYAAIREGRARGLRLEAGMLTRTGLAARARRLVSGIAGGTVLAFVLVFAISAAGLVAAAAGAGLLAPLLALLASLVFAIVAIATMLRRLRDSLGRIATQFGALASGDVRHVIEMVPVVELGAISRLLRSLRARLAYAEEVKAQQEADAAAKRVVALREMADTVESTVNETAEEVRRTMGAMTASAAEMSEASGAVNHNADDAAQAASEALSSAQAVAAATEQLAASVREITNRITHASGVTREAAQDGETAKQAITQLRNEVERIGHITSLIADIANQTNLLALNATIEAARAGDAGKGFAVVAAEVKKLAGQTAQATGDISSQIAEIQRATTETVDVVTRIGGKVEEIDQVSTAIAAAMEEQSVATQEISRSVASVATNAQSLTEKMGGMVTLAGQTNEMSARLRADAGELSRHTGDSRVRLVRAVRTSVAEAERRMHHRVSADEAAELVMDGRSHPGRLADISQGGARLRVDGAFAARAAGELRVPKLGLSAPCTIIQVGEGIVGLAFDRPVELPAWMGQPKTKAA